MVIAKRIFLFLVVNVLVMLTVSLTLSVLGVGRYTSAYGLDIGNLAVFCLVWGMAGSLISLAMSRFMAKMMMGVQVIDPHTTNPELRDLVVTVHRLAEQAGIPHPEVGIYQGHDVNAFATGPTKSRSLVAVSTGLLNSMNRDERNGVLGHEVAHIANGDMVTLTLVQGVVNAFVMFFARILGFVIGNALRGDSDDDRRSSFAGQGLITFLLEIVLSIFGSMAVAAFSRMREYRADLGGAQLAGRANMVNALRRLQALHNHNLADSEHPDGDKALAAFKISGKSGGFLALFSTHPPLEERIARLESARQL